MQFDKYILLLAGGSFGVSFAFIQQVVPKPDDSSVPFLIGAWVNFGVSILSTLISFIFSQKACKRAISIKRTKCEDVSNSWADSTQALNWTSMVFFILGISCLIIFAGQNLL